IGRLLGLSKKTAWFLCHRIRGSLRETKLAMPLGGQNKVVEADETYIGGKETNKNTVEGYFSILKRGIVGTFHHVSQQHLTRYLAEFDYRYNERVSLGVSDSERMRKSVQGIVGKRLTYRRSDYLPDF